MNAPLSRIGTPVAWMEDVKDKGEKIERYHRGFIFTAATYDAAGLPTSYSVRITSPHKYRDERVYVMPAGEVDAAFQLYRHLYEPEPLAANLLSLIASAKRAQGIEAGRRGFVESFIQHCRIEGEQAELPTIVRMALVWTDTTRDKDGKETPIKDTDGFITRVGEQFTIVVNKRIYDAVHETAVVSELFERVCSHASLREEQETEEA